jgi:hypothetical protein
VSPEESSTLVENEDMEKPIEQLSGKIDEHLTIYNTLREVNFCGEIYKVKQVLIDGVDVVQRVAELATKDLIPEGKGSEKTICNMCILILLQLQTA